MLRQCAQGKWLRLYLALLLRSFCFTAKLWAEKRSFSSVPKGLCCVFCKEGSFLHLDPLVVSLVLNCSTYTVHSCF